MKLHTIAFILLIIGGLAWGLEGVGFGVMSYVPSSVAMIIMILVGVAALFEAFTHKSNCKHCAPQGGM